MVRLWSAREVFGDGVRVFCEVVLRVKSVFCEALLSVKVVFCEGGLQGMEYEFSVRLC